MQRPLFIIMRLVANYASAITAISGYIYRGNAATGSGMADAQLSIFNVTSSLTQLLETEK